MIMETINIDWRCSDCGNVRRMEVTDPTRSVISHRPQGWVLDCGRVKCGLCAKTPGAPRPTSAPPRESAEEMRNRMSGLHMGRNDPSPAQGIGSSAGTSVTVRGEGGAKSHVQLQGEARYSNYGEQQKAAPTSEAIPVNPADGWTGPPPTKVGGIQSMGVGRGPNVVIEDTRNSEFLGPEKSVAGVPRLTDACIGCHMTIKDGTTGYGGSEAWRLAKDSTFERGHPDCLARMGR